MNNPLDPSLRELNDCDCCAGTSAQTPALIDNRPGLQSIGFRAGVHSQFKDTLLSSLSSHLHPALRDLRTRENDDFTIALLDAFASIADVLTFYSERIANEAYLRTATERRSVLELARAIGYELAPGVAAGVMLSFTIEGGTGAPGTAIISKGTKVQSIPGPDEKPQTFETSREFTGWATWNELRPRLRAAPLRGSALLATDELFLDGTVTNISPGDVLVLSDGATAHARRVAALEVDRDRDHTQVKLELSKAPKAASETPRVAAMLPAAKPNSTLIADQPTKQAVAELFLDGSVSQHQLNSMGHFQHWDLAAVQSHLNKLPKVVLSTSDAGVFAMRARLGFFGHNAPKWKSLPHTKVVTTTTTPSGSSTAITFENDVYPKTWDTGHRTIWEDSQDILHTGFDAFLDGTVPEGLKDSWVVLQTPGEDLLPLRVGPRPADVSRADYAISAKCTGLQLQKIDGNAITTKDEAYKNRTTTAYAESEPLTVIGAPIETNLQKGDVELPLDRVDKDLTVGQVLALQGENADLAGTVQREIIVIAAINHSSVTTLTIHKGLEHSYVRSTVTLNANVVPATHGETTDEVLGNGDATQPFQSFVLKQKPLTYAFPPGAGQPESSLQIWVDDVKWSEVSTFYQSGPNDRVYVVRHADDGPTTVKFGDGRRGARLPTGRENVRAVYRKGIGLDGLVKGDQISLLLTQPLGVKTVSNLLAPQGAQNPQSLNDARVNAPRTVLTLDRVVSLQDYEDFAQNFPGVEKAHAAWTWAGQTRGVLLTLLGPNGLVIGATGQPAKPLTTALARQGIARVPVRIATRSPSLFSVTGIVRVDADRIPSIVEAAVKSAMLSAFSFASRQFGQGVHLSEVIAVIQNVPGVAFIDMQEFKKTSVVDGLTKISVAEKGYLTAHQPANGGDTLLAEPAEILVLDELALSQLEVKAL